MRFEKVAVIASAGGAALDAAIAIAPDIAEQIVLATDRSCGAELLVPKYGLDHIRFVGSTNRERSVNLYNSLREIGVKKGLMIYSRLITSELFENLEIYNIHPSLLPAFPGIGAVLKAHESNVRILGATLHLVDQGMDTGPIVAQISSVVDPVADIEIWNKASFLHKTYLLLLFFAHVAKKARSSVATCSQLLPHSWHSRFLEYQDAEGFPIFFDQARS